MQFMIIYFFVIFNVFLSKHAIQFQIFQLLPYIKYNTIILNYEFFTFLFFKYQRILILVILQFLN